MYLELQSIREEYQFAKRAGNFDRTLARLMAAERNVWISGSAFGLWVILHRYRSMLKKYYRFIDNGVEGLKVINGAVYVESVHADIEASIKDPVAKKNE
jgi:hypothetical protein